MYYIVWQLESNISHEDVNVNPLIVEQINRNAVVEDYCHKNKINKSVKIRVMLFDELYKLETYTYKVEPNMRYDLILV